MFVKPRDTLTVLFNDEMFENMYIEYNQKQKHNCREHTYGRFCCGKAYKKNMFFLSNELAIQIKLFVDNFEPCDALKSKRGKHKVTAYYMQINNLPEKFASKTSNLYLVALSGGINSKNIYANTDNVIETIVNDFKSLENIGIKTKSGLTLKGSIMCTMADNLGANSLLGLKESFNSNNYCRICTAPKNECYEMTIENASHLRTITKNYNECLQSLESEQELSKGIKGYCHLNVLKHFHTMTNFTVDFMHDILEGVASFTLENIFNFIITDKVATLEQIQHLIDCFHFGSLFEANILSKIKLKQKNLGQNASQL